MSRDIGVVMDPIHACNYKKDTSLALLWAARDRGWRLWYMEQHNLYLDGGAARGKMQPLEVREDPDDSTLWGAWKTRTWRTWTPF